MQQQDINQPFQNTASINGCFEIIEKAQDSFLALHQGLGIEQLNHIPEGFKNNLIWNYAHVLSALQMICYGRSGLPLQLDEAFVHAYKVGSKPEKLVTLEEYETYKTFAVKGIAQLQEDYGNGHFKDFKAFTTSTGFEIATIEHAIFFVALHHGMHLGYTMAIKKLVVNNQ